MNPVTLTDPLTRRFEVFATATGVLALEPVLALFDELPAVEVDEMTGEWDGGLIATGHPGEAQLSALRWVGKHMRGRDDVDPLICLDDDGRRSVNDALGSASLRHVEYREALTATMVYDSHPVFDHFRRVNDDVVLGAMDRKGDARPLMFFLRRR